jgi:hypothetical protein
MVIDDEANYWTVSVQDPGASKTLYQAHRGTLRGAKLAGIEFILFYLDGATAADRKPEQVETTLVWSVGW